MAMLLLRRVTALAGRWARVVGHHLGSSKDQASVDLTAPGGMLQVFQQVGDGIFVHAISGGIRAVNDQACQMLGYTRGELLRMNIFEVLVSNDYDGLRRAWAAMTPGQAITVQRLNRRKDGTTIHVENRVVMMRTASENLILASVRDIGDRLEVVRQVTESGEEYRQAAHTDYLTGLPNRRSFVAVLGESLAAAGDIAVAFVDLDGLKEVNDTLGHEAGDQLIRAVATRLAQTLSGSHDVFARLGGDEFAALIIDSDGNAAEAVAERLVVAARLPLKLGTQTYRGSASVGLAFAQHGMSGSEVLRAADQAMYEAKRRGGDRWVIAGSSSPP
jgi:diguanylate cyclase (GGDEF)-like protein/PAS domain S-box-containing protein